MDLMKKHIIGLTGLACTGKTEAKEIMRELGVEVIHADGIVHELLNTKEVTESIASAFTEDVLLPDCTLDRKKLARIVFGNVDALRRLEAILHPLVRQHIGTAANTFFSDDNPARALVLEVPLLFRSGIDKYCDVIWLLESSFEVRLVRAKSRGWDEAELCRRDEHADDFSKLGNVVRVYNNGNLNQFRRTIIQLWRGLT